MRHFRRISLYMRWLLSFTFPSRALNIFRTLRNEARSVLSPVYNEFVVQEWVKDKLDHSIHQLEKKKTEINALRKAAAAAKKWKLRNLWLRNKYKFDSSSGGRIPSRWDWMCLVHVTSLRRFFDAGQQLTKARGTIRSITMEFPLSRHVSSLSRASSPSTRSWKDNYRRSHEPRMQILHSYSAFFMLIYFKWAEVLRRKLWALIMRQRNRFLGALVLLWNFR